MDPRSPMNPYAPPQAATLPVGSVATAAARIEGPALVVTNQATFPPVCLKCGGVNAIEWRDQKFMYVPPWARFLGGLLQMAFAKRSRFQLPVCPPCHRQWKKWNWVMWLWIPGLVVAVAGASLTGSDSGNLGPAVLFGGMVLAGAGLVGLIAAMATRGKRVVYVTKIDKTHSWLRGVHETAMQAVVSGR
jgi:hypothetical protein